MKRIVCVVLLATLLAGSLVGCGDSRNGLKDFVTLTLWHTYVDPLRASIDFLIEEFNETVGAGEGIRIETTLVADATNLNDKLLAAAYDEPGAPELPDIAVIYPRIALDLADKGLLMDFAEQFGEVELSLFVPAFLEEGRLGGDTLYLLPIAKSTEVLYVNTTIFDRFATATGAELSQLSTIEGILDAAEKYLEWSGGKAFFYPEDLFNFSMIGFEQLGDSFVKGRELDFSSPVFRSIWDAYYPLAVKGGISIFDRYNSYLIQIGEIVCATGTSAGASFCPDTVTYADNTTEEANIVILPYPVFEGGDKTALQRGGGMCVFKSDARRQAAASVFLKWLTAPDQNLRFTAGTGYMPVTVSAFGDYLSGGAENIDNIHIRRVMETISAMHDSYEFFIPPVFADFDDLQRVFSNDLRRVAENDRREYLRLLSSLDPHSAFDAASKNGYEAFVSGR